MEFMGYEQIDLAPARSNWKHKMKISCISVPRWWLCNHREPPLWRGSLPRGRSYAQLCHPISSLPFSTLCPSPTHDEEDDPTAFLLVAATLFLRSASACHLLHISSWRCSPNQIAILERAERTAHNVSFFCLSCLGVSPSMSYLYRKPRT